MSSVSDIPPDIAKLTGPLLLGVVFNWGLLGALIVQVYIYHTAFQRDKIILKTLVWSTFVLEVLGTVMITRDAFRVFGTGFGNMEPIETVGWLWFSGPVLNSIISCSAQFFYAWRIWVLSSSYWVPGAILLLACVQGGTGFYSGWFVQYVGVWSRVPEAYRTTCVWLGGTALCDVLITGTMIYFLRRSRTGFKATTNILDKFTRVTVETGFVCAAFALLDLAFFLAFQSNNYHLAPNLPLSKLYSNSLLAVFNARARIGSSSSLTDTDDGMTAYPSRVHTTSSLVVAPNTKATSAATTGGRRTINVQITQTCELDSRRDDSDAVALGTVDSFKHGSMHGYESSSKNLSAV